MAFVSRHLRPPFPTWPSSPFPTTLLSAKFPSYFPRLCAVPSAPQPALCASHSRLFSRASPSGSGFITGVLLFPLPPAFCFPLFLCFLPSILSCFFGGFYNGNLSLYIFISVPLSLTDSCLHRRPGPALRQGPHCWPRLLPQLPPSSLHGKSVRQSRALSPYFW